MCKQIELKHFFSFLLALSLVWLSSTQMQAQVNYNEIPTGKQRAIDAEKAILQLKDGVLLVRLVSQKAKKEQISHILESKTLSEKDRDKMQKELELIETETEDKNQRYLSKFKELYSFSDFRFTYDYLISEYLEGARSGFMLDDSLEVDPSIELPEGKTVFVLKIDSPKPSSTKNNYGFLVTDSLQQEIYSPFPGEYMGASMRRFWGNLLDKQNYPERESVWLVTKLEEGLEEYYERVN